ncbi:DNA repair protein RecO [Patescibacteria group bacterium]
MFKVFSDEAIVLARRNFSEADRILSVYSKSHGRISLIAKGVRRPKSRKRGHIEVFNIIKFQAANGHTLDIVTEAEIITHYKKIRKSLKKVSLAYYICEVIGKITKEGEENKKLFELIKDTLDNLEVQSELKLLRKEFLSELLVLLGYWPKGRPLENPDGVLEEVVERQINSIRVGKRVLE